MLVGCEVNPLEEFRTSFRGTFERSDVNAWMGKEGCGQVVSTLVLSEELEKSTGCCVAHTVFRSGLLTHHQLALAGVAQWLQCHPAD